MVYLTFSLVHDALRQRQFITEKRAGGRSRTIVHLRNRLCSPPLQLPTEIIIRILSFVTADLDSHLHADVWKPIYSTITGFTKSRSKGNPWVVVSDLLSVFYERLVVSLNILDRWREQGFRGHNIHPYSRVRRFPVQFRSLLLDSRTIPSSC